MDKRFIFRYRLHMIKSSRVTLGGRPGAVLELLPPSTQFLERGARCGAAALNKQGDPVEPPGQEKPWEGKVQAPVPQTDTGGRG